MSTPLLRNILNQAEALRAVAEHQFGEGRAALLRGAALLRSKKRIVLSGMGASCFACTPLYYRLAQRGVQVTSVETSELLYFLPALLEEDTATVLVSRSGESVEAVKLLPTLKRQKSAVVGIVNVPGSVLSLEADETIVMGSPVDQLVAIQTYTATLVTLALLEAAMFDELDQARIDLQKTTELLSPLIPECVENSEGWREFLENDGPVYLLGRGPALGAVFEGVLLMHEVAKSPAVGISGAQFRHGPVEVVDSRFRAILIGTQPVTAPWDIALAKDLAKMGGQARWIGPVAEGAGIEPLLAWPEGVPARFAPVIETIPLQMAAYRKAEIRGVTPGDFRWAPLVTTSEAGFFLPGQG